MGVHKGLDSGQIAFHLNDLCNRLAARTKKTDDQGKVENKTSHRPSTVSDNMIGNPRGKCLLLSILVSFGC